MAYKRVYAQSGEPFDVPEIRANDLILQKGWTQQPPVESKPVAETVSENGEESDDSPKPKRTVRTKTEFNSPE